MAPEVGVHATGVVETGTETRIVGERIDTMIASATGAEIVSMIDASVLNGEVAV